MYVSGFSQAINRFDNFYGDKILGDTSSEAQNPNRNQLNVESQSLSRQYNWASDLRGIRGGGSRIEKKVFSLF